MENAVTQGPNEAYEYVIDWETVLSGDVIQSSTWATAPAGLVEGLDTFTPKTTTLWLSGGVDGEDYIVTNTIVTLGGRTFERDLRYRVRRLFL